MNKTADILYSPLSVESPFLVVAVLPISNHFEQFVTL